MQSLEGKYGYVKGRAEETPERERTTMPVFSEGCGDVVRSIGDCVRDSLSYRFTTERQFAEILRCHGVRVQEGLGTRDLTVHLSFQGLDREGRPCTGSISDAQLSFDVREALDRRLEECRMTDAPQERSELRQTLSEALSASSDIPSLRAALRGKHIDLVIYTDREGQPRGTTLIDHRSKCAFKGSEVSRSLSGALLSLSSGPSLPGGASSDDRDGRTSDGDRHTESTDDGRPSSWNLSTTCCPWCCPRAKSPPQALWGLCRLGDSTSSLGHPTPQRIGISPASPAAGSVWRPGHHREPAHAQD